MSTNRLKLKRSQHLLLALLWPLTFLEASTSPCFAAIRLEVLRGEGSNNNAARGSAISPMVRVLDADGQPMGDVLVVFTAPFKGPSVLFAGFEADANTYTNQAGVALAPRIRPITGNGPLTIRVTASHAGQFANVTLNQINLGLDEEANMSRELAIVRLPTVRSPESRPDGPSDFLVRVEDGKGNPVNLAKVEFVLLRSTRGDKLEELSRMMIVTGPTGEALSTISKQVAKNHYEFAVEAREGGRRATRYFPIK